MGSDRNSLLFEGLNVNGACSRIDSRSIASIGSLNHFSPLTPGNEEAVLQLKKEVDISFRTLSEAKLTAVLSFFYQLKFLFHYVSCLSFAPKLIDQRGQFP